MKQNGYYKRKKRISITPLLIFTSTLLFAVITLIYIYSSLSPMIFETAKKRAHSFTTYTISKTISDILSTEKNTYNDIVHFEKNNNGDITALTTNMVNMNQLKAKICTGIYNNIYNIRDDDLSFKLGAAFGNIFFHRFGPIIKVRIHSISNIGADFEHQFISGGINQTNHRIYLRINAEYSLLVPFSVISEKIDTSFCVAENIIVGKIPEAFTNVQNYGENESSNVADEVVDFGAHVNLN